MVPFNEAAQATKVRRCRVPDYGPWPPVGYVTPRKVMAALGGVSDETVRNYERAGLLPPRRPITGATGGWPVEEIREAIAALPGKLKARADERRRDKVKALTKARAARGQVPA
jgi:hypothetical protein